MKKLTIIVFLSVLTILLSGCHVKLVCLQFNNKTNDTINVHLGRHSMDTIINYSLDIKPKKEGGLVTGKFIDLSVKESVIKSFETILILRNKQDTILNLRNNNEVRDYLKDKKVVSRNVLVANIKETNK